MTETYDIEELAEEQNMTGYLRQGILLGTFMSSGIDAVPVFFEGSTNYTPDKLTIRVPHPIHNTTLVYTMVTESVVEE